VFSSCGEVSLGEIRSTGGGLWMRGSDGWSWTGWLGETGDIEDGGGVLRHLVGGELCATTGDFGSGDLRMLEGLVIVGERLEGDLKDGFLMGSSSSEPEEAWDGALSST